MQKSNKLICLALLIIIFQPLFACTHVLWSRNGQAVLIGRTMDWTQDTHPALLILPRGMKRSGSHDKNPLKWTSIYGSLVTSVIGVRAIEGMNEKGLSAALLWEGKTSYTKRKLDEPGLSIYQWAQFYLDNFATVDQAIRYTNSHTMQILPQFFGPKNSRIEVKLHLVINDPSGDSAVLEYIHGDIHIYHAHQYTVLTNTPTFPRQLLHLSHYKIGHTFAPMGTSSEDRFVRASMTLAQLSKPKTLNDAVQTMFHLMKQVSEPMIKKPDVYPTQWTSVSDLTHRVYYFKSTLHPEITWVALNQMSFNKNAPVMQFVFNEHPHANGDVIDEFKKASRFKR